MIRIGALAAMLALAPACAALRPALPTRGCPVQLVPSADLPPNLVLRTRMSFRARDRQVGLETVARGTPDELVVVGLSSYGIRLFAVRQRGRTLSIEGASAPSNRRLALWVMDLLHRAYWIQPPPGVQGQPVTRWTWNEEWVTRSEQGGSVRVEYGRSDEEPAVAGVTIQYAEGSGAGPGAGLEVRNAWCGYEALATSLEAVSVGAEPESRIPQPGGAAR